MPDYSSFGRRMVYGPLSGGYPAHLYFASLADGTKCNITFTLYRPTVLKCFETASRHGENVTLLIFCYLNVLT
jgi:hypothetical protein